MKIWICSLGMLSVSCSQGIHHVLDSCSPASTLQESLDSLAAL